MKRKLDLNFKLVLESLQHFITTTCLKFFDSMHLTFFFGFYTEKCIFEFAVLNIYIKDRPLVFWDYKSHFTHRFI